MLSKTYGIKLCLWCGDKFTASKSNQVYCKTECTRKASNQKIIERYHASKAAKVNDRFCADCNAKLSRYNEDSICNPCRQNKKELDRIDFLRKLGFEYINEE
jgi:methylphosphotriester-DNA--protein-cysteine methyltransferase